VPWSRVAWHGGLHRLGNRWEEEWY
jgi:hypothetical protein